MPYVSKDRRPAVNQEYESICIKKQGDLAAVIFDLMLRFIDQDAEPNFDRIQNAIGGAEAAIDEIKYIKKYYETKVEERNGSFPLQEKIQKKIDNKFKEQ